MFRLKVAIACLQRFDITLTLTWILLIDNVIGSGFIRHWSPETLRSLWGLELRDDFFNLFTNDSISPIKSN